MRLSRSAIEKNLAKFADFLQESFFADQTAKKNGWLQKVDPRIKLAGCFFLLFCSSFSHHLTSILFIYAFALILALGSGIFSVIFVRKIWLYVPIYAAIIALPSLFLVHGNPVYRFGETNMVITKQGLTAAAFLVSRVAVSVALMLVLVLTTSWQDLLKALRTLFVPKIIVLMLSMTYRYIYLLLLVASNLFLAKKSRRVGPEDWRTTRKWLEGTLGTLVGKSLQTSQDVHLAMISRGFQGEPQILNQFRLQFADYVWAVVFVTIGIAAVTLP
jgi:cobalt/nickel transport system permease protein